jgi:hypothetical protein
MAEIFGGSDIPLQDPCGFFGSVDNVHVQYSQSFRAQMPMIHDAPRAILSGTSREARSTLTLSLENSESSILSLFPVRHIRVWKEVVLMVCFYLLLGSAKNKY